MLILFYSALVLIGLPQFICKAVTRAKMLGIQEDGSLVALDRVVDMSFGFQDDSEIVVIVWLVRVDADGLLYEIDSNPGAPGGVRKQPKQVQCIGIPGVLAEYLAIQ